MSQANPSSAPSAQQRFLGLLKNDILKLSLAELDFGIYRILNYRRAKVLAYLDDTLPGRITAWTSTLEQASGRALASTEADHCYYHLHTFFSRYWDDGDFIPRARRGGTPAYAVPYNGEDTHFHWATKGSHYIKSGELFARYAYTDGELEVRFVIERADVEKDNAKGSAKIFFPISVQALAGGVELRWQWRAATDAENKRYKNKSASRTIDVGQSDISSEEEDETPGAEGASLQERVLNAWLLGADLKGAKAPASLNPVLLASNARRFVRKNTSDFFVHPHLGEFLRGELDVYLKHEFVQVWDAPDDELPRIRAKFKLVRDIALDLITFLDQIERFQATLFEKRKFVLQADYLVQCSWLQREGGDEGQKLVLEAAASAEQAKEWATWVGDKSKKTNGKKLLGAYPHLPLHTRHFSADFKARVLACFDDIEAALGGELIHADNYAALRTLEPAYRERVKCIYIDPPYNTGGDGFLYKDEFTKHSSWASLMDTRLGAARDVLTKNGVLFSSIDLNERFALGRLLELRFGAENAVGEIIWNNVTDNNPTQIANEHEYVLCVANVVSALDPAWKNRLSASKDALVRIGNELIASHADDETLKSAYANWFRENKAFLGQMDRYKYIDQGGVYTGSQSVHNPGKEGYRYDVLHPTTGEPCKQPLMGYRFPEETMKKLLADKKILFGADHSKLIELKVYAHEYEEKLSSVLTLDGRSGANDLRAMFANGLPFKNPKPTSLLEHILPFVVNAGDTALDFFAGSATTGHAVINLNREDGGARKFLLVEQGEYFDSVTLPRIAKVMTAPEWKDGAPKDSVQHTAEGTASAPTPADEHWSRLTLPLVRVLRLERYEDSLNALDFEQNQPLAPAEHAQAAITFVAHDAQEHLLRYWLMDDSAGQAVRLSTAKLTHPFDYQLTLHEPTGERVVTVDLLETARLLLGLAPKRQRTLTDPQGQRHQLMEAVLASDLARGAPQPQPVLLWLRSVDDSRSDEAAQAEHAWLVQAVQAEFKRALSDYATLFHNRAAWWPLGLCGTPIDALLEQRMMERAA
ncbi:MAG: site-specific DNA-methyltransferase [Gammaproteobacteria bacterium]|uniref:site-specific DNA-methyltransferase n=1 Tax=Rhodoferax sp. TaxID=50421 RepID=UPI001DF7CA8B|nr:site-specific DNA-methyltransferase [Rhodoferax sp.]MBU3897357.1 site-specific DNA-methyltransferase [Gammaproteobacteria bacterium]MBU3999236.1 site-specific DNA-methyltransferase [Gammaproteobacteria bacterium]MBU4018703.1 site-specific DNA-methyltransferase [Gammaproteobacteria bacterium]MBU4079658.1 site-specific DNA-methyltransferase [Gammaproteobacteria bacterium]MBU4112833.1 site-specific DNA-methyltransferase [Gammaproteobacteria bacterium]